MVRLGFVVGVAVLAVTAPGCAGGSPGGNGSAGSGGGSTGAGGAAGSTGAGGSAGSAGTTGTGGSTTGAAGNSGTTGSGGTTGAAGSSGAAGSGGSAGSTGRGGSTAGSGGSAGGTGGSGAGTGGSAGGAAGRGGSTGTAGAGGTGGNTTPHGSAARFICPAGPFASNPLTGMGTVNQVTAPSPDYFAFLEGPVWIGSLSTLFFSDNASSPTERIWKLVPPSTTPTIFVAASGSNGLGVDNNDQIIATIQRAPYGINRFNPMTGQAGTLIATTAKPNDVIVRSDNNIYFTDPSSGFYRIAPGATTVSAAMKLPNNGGQPNGIELSLDENTLYVGDVAQQKIFKFTLAADGTVMTSTGAELVSQTMRTTVDGMCIDCAGNIYAGTQGAIEVYSSTGSYIGSIVTNAQTSNCTFGGADRKTLYMTTPAALKYVTLGIPGLPD